MAHDTVTEQRRPRWVYGVGAEPDPRFSLANERTYLAWIRTSLALMAAGVALAVFDPGDGAPAGRIAAVLLVGSSVLLPLHAWWSWARVERSVRQNQPLPSPRAGAIVAVVLAAVGVLVVWSILA